MKIQALALLSFNALSAEARLSGVVFDSTAQVPAREGTAAVRADGEALGKKLEQVLTSICAFLLACCFPTWFGCSCFCFSYFFQSAFAVDASDVILSCFLFLFAVNVLLSCFPQCFFLVFLSTDCVHAVLDCCDHLLLVSCSQCCFLFGDHSFLHCFT